MAIPKGLRPGVYIASFFDTRDRLLPIVAQLEAGGHYKVTARWLLEPPGQTGLEYWPGHAQRDIEDIGRSQLVIIDTIDVTPRGGREVELGLAMASGKQAILVGPVRNVFHSLINTRFTNWDEALEFLGAVDQALVLS